MNIQYLLYVYVSMPNNLQYISEIQNITITDADFAFTKMMNQFTDEYMSHQTSLRWEIEANRRPNIYIYIYIYIYI